MVVAFAVKRLQGRHLDDEMAVPIWEAYKIVAVRVCVEFHALEVVIILFRRFNLAIGTH